MALLTAFSSLHSTVLRPSAALTACRPPCRKGGPRSGEVCYYIAGRRRGEWAPRAPAAHGDRRRHTLASSRPVCP